MLRKIVEVYALRARQYSDAVALLGRHDHTSPELLALAQKLKRLQALCDEAAGEFEQYVSQTAKPHVAD